MLTYRDIKNETDRAAEIWQAEQNLPRWFRDASRAWTPDFESFEKFWSECTEIYGLFRAERLLACVYLEIDGSSVNIHVSVIEKTDESDLVRFFKSLVTKKRLEHIIHMRAWILAKNRFLLKIAREVGFVETGLKMRFGSSNGRVLSWHQVIIPV